MIKKLFRMIGCDHKDTRYKSDNPKYRYVEVCQKCGSKKYIK